MGDHSTEPGVAPYPKKEKIIHKLFDNATVYYLYSNYATLQMNF